MAIERLTSKDGIYLKCEGITPCKVYEKLKEYEDLGFTPEDIAYMANFFKERTSAEYIANDMHIAAKLLKAEREEAHWIPSKACTLHTWDEINYVDGYECSKCGRFETEKEPYCNCGCKMTEVI